MNLDDPEVKPIVDQVLEIEWGFFHNVNNAGGPAACQSMPRTFAVARRAQFGTWTPAAVASWLDDLVSYAERGENPFTFKYGYMMRGTHPDEYERIKDLLPEVEPERAALVEALVDCETAWADELAEQYPHYAARSRPARSDGDSEDWTSIETYARSEFSTYSKRTLELVLGAYTDARDRGENVSITTAEAQARSFGYASLADCDRAIAEGRMSQTGLDGSTARACGA